MAVGQPSFRATSALIAASQGFEAPGPCVPPSGRRSRLLIRVSWTHLVGYAPRESEVFIFYFFLPAQLDKK